MTQSLLSLPLLEEVEKGKQGPMALYRRLEFAYQIAEALRTLHGCQIVHGNLSLENVVVVRNQLYDPHPCSDQLTHDCRPKTESK
jgi:serine/threonine protein kinase